MLLGLGARGILVLSWPTEIYALAVLAGWNVRRVEIPWVRWCSECATAEHPFKPVRTSFHTGCLGVKTPSHPYTTKNDDSTVPHRDAARATPQTHALRATSNPLELMRRPCSTTEPPQTTLQP